MTDNSKNRRQYERIRKGYPVRFRPFLDISQADLELTGTVIDIGGGGMRFSSPDSQEPGTQLLITVAFPGWHEKDGQWNATADGKKRSILKMIGIVLESRVSDTDLQQFEIRVNFAGRVS